VNSLTAESLSLARSLGSATIHEAAGRIGDLPARFHPVSAGMVLAGPAFTVVCPPGDNLWIHRALYAAQPGDVLVVSTGDREPLWGYWGEILSVAAQARKLGGLVLEGGSRDHAALPTVGFPVISLGPCIRGTIKDKESTVGRLGAEIEIGGVVIRPGDLLVGDQDGVVVIAAKDAEATVNAGREREAKEATVMDSLRNGATTIDIYGLG